MKVVLAYSGGLDTTVLLTWLQEKYNAEVICYCSNVGQEEELDGLEEKALKHGAVKCYVDNVEEEFAADYIYPIMQANAIYEGTYLLGTSIARPLIAKRMIDIAIEEGAEAICHGATGKGNDQVRFELTAYALKPDVKVIAPWRMPEDFPFEGRTDMIQYLEDRGIPTTVSAAKPYSMDRNMLHISFEGGILEDPWNSPDDEGMWCMTKPLSQAADEAETIEISFEKGIPVAVNGDKLSPATLLKKLNAIGCEHGVGRIDIVENRFTGMKDRGVYETPGGTILHHAHRALESITMDREVMHLRDSFIPKYAELVYNGFWFAPEREMLQAAISQSQETCTGDVRVKLFKGGVHVCRRSPYSLYSPELVSFDEAGGYDQSDATGFIKLNALRLRVGATMKAKNKE